MTAYERRREIVRILCARKNDTRENLAFEFGVCIRTIDYDIERLSLEVPIYTVLGRHGGVFIDKDYIPKQTHFLSREQLNVLFQLSNGIQDHNASILESIMDEFRSPAVRG